MQSKNNGGKMIHKTCGTKLKIEHGESPARGYGWFYCPKCKKRIPKTEITQEIK